MPKTYGSSDPSRDCFLRFADLPQVESKVCFADKAVFGLRSIDCIRRCNLPRRKSVWVSGHLIFSET